ncbi:MAG: DUF4197 domain-containing protein [Planctomycetota bacterium]|nr:DUF4197 domain-containing protein [Planctomycetota bacterium]
MTRAIRFLSAATALFVLGGCVSVDTSTFMSQFAGSGALDTGTIVSGLKQALEVGTGNAVASTGRTGGYWSNLAIRIVMPEKFQSVAATLRKVGMGAQVDAFERKMNDAAEAAATQAAPIFVDAIRQMSFADARAILTGPDTAATDYFRAKTSASLKALYQPVVTARMRELGVVATYDGLLAKYAAIPLTTKPALPRIEDYVTDRALEGLFKIVAQEEQQIRHNPAARTTALLQRVFGGPS